MADEKPLSTLVNQGWEIVSYASGTDHRQATPTDNFLLRRTKALKLVKIRKKWIGQGYVVTEMDL